MKYVSYHHDTILLGGILVGDEVSDLNQLLAAAGETEVAGLRCFLERSGSELPAISAKLSKVIESAAIAPVGKLDAVRLGPVIPDPQKVLCIGLNYADHVAETGRKLPEYPDIFAKFASTLIGPKDDIRCSDMTDNLDFEGELALVIGRSATKVNEEDALDHVAGLMVLNDITARDLQYRGTQWLAGKALDGSTPCGPALVTLDEIEDVYALDICTRVNGVTLQSSNTRYQIFNLARLVSYISGFLTLNSGDIITTGTPEGIGAKHTPPLWLNSGDVVEVEVAGVGLLRNTVR
ncbi:fumarylacetoacetate hydrolase family protein [Rhizobium leguminosarum]|uniref:fumarylacetoacetate hydrolase family protein n=1 Tax=Rhizobium leguminosarum TaxID=384 RepID=UPI00098EABFF|nr:fumarylacetoacetate hydrolase family protein [Rhizobium leguminosarum]ASS58101.1 5-oxopent-3-ene-1,2,5-tricarboxylate decarboxylase [Rhizobium leguminosarum bv. viciae]MBB4330031.1 2-keto-4-pentenoate hydratase/2-oxohepta-3-ene-1,7-dioic acid hydratase in catechol pathway [Rhizobium leguminosarum]MBB4355426.1 2-keto-4-pentenoate hydratase/2-oxohepta-3-ene-1,7-dioic acid hydratase in catechol pathway [Rhizobium leguminosarum]MBB4390035.1 2-keto-4-pentenoate hydratase/2-oxohepta-3-ene-1,7-dioi